MIEVTNGNGERHELDGVLEAMVRVLLDNQDRIEKEREGCVELHFARGSGKVHGRLRQHIGLERIERAGK